MTRARALRADGDLASTTRALDEAARIGDELDADHPLRRKTRWRLAKVHHDARRPDLALTALEPLFEADDPFLGYPTGLDAVGPLAVQAWHRGGYGDLRVDRLFQAVEQAVAGDPVRATQARLQRLWARACRGDRHGLAQELEAFARLEPGAFADGPSRHPRALDAAGSLPWLQLDAARTVLRAAPWARDPALGAPAGDHVGDAAPPPGLERTGEIWFLEPIALVRRRLGRPDPDDYATAWFALAGRIDYPRRAYHHRVALAEAARAVDPDRTVLRYREAATVARESDHGPEWIVDATIQAGDRAEARALVARYGLEVFGPSLSDTSLT